MKLSTLNVEKFRAFILKGGAEELPTTDPYVVLRFRKGIGRGFPGMVYRSKSGFTLTGAALEAFDRYSRNKPWKASDNYQPWERPEVIETLINRDGENCFYCEEPLKENITVEHLLSQVHGGSNHIANLCLAHRECNQMAGQLSVVEKIKLRKVK